MKVIKVNGQEYKIKFGYLAVSNGNILSDVLSMTDTLETAARKEADKEEIDSATSMKLIADLIPLVGRITLAGLQKYHKDVYGVDYENEKDVKDKLALVYELLDEYFDPEDGQPEESAIEMFWDFVNELRGSGFLSGKNAEEAENLPKQPQDHKKAEK